MTRQARTDIAGRFVFGYSIAETRQFAGTCLMRRLKVIGLQ